MKAPSSLSRRYVLPTFVGLVGLVACSAGSEPSATGRTESASTSTDPASSPLGSPTPVWNAAWSSADVTFGLPSGVSVSGVTPNVTASPRGLELFEVGLNGHVYHRTSTDQGRSWSAPDDIGGGWSFNQSIGAASNNGQLVVAAVKGDQTIWTNTYVYSSGRWYGWINTGGQTRASGVAVAASSSYFYLGAIGLEGNLWYDYALIPGDPGGWFGWTDLGGTCDPYLAPAAASWGGDRVDFMVARVNDDEAFHTSVQDEQQGDWGDLGAVIGGMRGGGMAMSSWGANHLDLFIRTPAGNLLQKTWDGAWSGWSTLLTGDNTGMPRATSWLWNPGRIDLFTQGTDLSFWHTFYGAGASSAPGPQPFYCGSHGAQCCASTVPGAHTGCIDPNDDACDPGTNSCTSCGLGDGQMCCPMVGYTHHQCKSGWACNAQSDRCEGPAECGHAGHICCNDGCHDGSACVGRTDDSLGVCVAPQGVCAGAGAACGAQGCCNGLSCQMGKCASPGRTTCNGKAATSSAQFFPLEIRNPNTLCAIEGVAPYANSQQEAIACAQASNPGANVVPGTATETIGAYEYHFFTGNSCGEFTAEAFSQSDADTCAVATIGVDVSSGACP